MFVGDSRKFVLMKISRYSVVPILHGGLLNHMTIVTKVGVSYDDHMNDDVPEVDSFSHGCYQALSSPRFCLGMRLM